MSTSIPSARRLSLIGRVPGFASLPPEIIADLAAQCGEEQFVAGARVLQEGETADRLFIVESGRAQVRSGADAGEVVLADLEPGDLFGEIALLSTDRRRKASVLALEPLVTLSLGVAEFEAVLARHPEVRLDLVATADSLLTRKYLKLRGI